MKALKFTSVVILILWTGCHGLLALQMGLQKNLNGISGFPQQQPVIKGEKIVRQNPHLALEGLHQYFIVWPYWIF